MKIIEIKIPNFVLDVPKNRDGKYFYFEIIASINLSNCFYESDQFISMFYVISI